MPFSLTIAFTLGAHVGTQKDASWDYIIAMEMEDVRRPFLFPFCESHAVISDRLLLPYMDLCL